MQFPFNRCDVAANYSGIALAPAASGVSSESHVRILFDREHVCEYPVGCNLSISLSGSSL